jgi:hypothetical protein
MMDELSVGANTRGRVAQLPTGENEERCEIKSKKKQNDLPTVKTTVHPLATPHRLQQLESNATKESSDDSSTSSSSSSSPDIDVTSREDHKVNYEGAEQKLKETERGAKAGRGSESSSSSSGSSALNESPFAAERTFAYLGTRSIDSGDKDSGTSSSNEGSPSDSNNSSEDKTKQENNSKLSLLINLQEKNKQLPDNEPDSDGSSSSNDEEGLSAPGEKFSDEKQPFFGKATVSFDGGRVSTNRTRVIVDSSDARGKIKVMLGPRIRKTWESKARTLPSKESEFQLLGNMGVSRWDEDDSDRESDEGNTSVAKNPSGSEIRGVRQKIVETLEKQDRSRKRKMHLNRWDAHLDQGRQKKVKSASNTAERPTNTDPKNNLFHKIQAGVQRLNKGRPKGFFRRTDKLRQRNR